jgi:hypothetical protein
MGKHPRDMQLDSRNKMREAGAGSCRKSKSEKAGAAWRDHSVIVGAPARDADVLILGVLARVEAVLAGSARAGHSVSNRRVDGTADC